MELCKFTDYMVLEAIKKSNYKDSRLVYTFAKLLRAEFRNWDAYKYGIIDNQGNVINAPETIQQKQSFGTLENIARKVKRALVKYAGKGNLVTNLIALFLLRNESFIPNANQIRLEILDELTNSEIEIVETILVELKRYKFILERE